MSTTWPLLTRLIIIGIMTMALVGCSLGQGPGGDQSAGQRPTQATSNTAAMPTPKAIPEFPPVSSQEGSFTNGAEKRWEIDLAATFPELTNPRLNFTPRGEVDNLLKLGPLVINDTWIFQIEADDQYLLAGFDAQTGALNWQTGSSAGTKCDALPSGSALACADWSSGRVFLLDSAGTRTEITQNAAELHSAAVDSWVGGTVIWLQEKTGPMHLIGLDPSGAIAWQQDLAEGYQPPSSQYTIAGDRFLMKPDPYNDDAPSLVYSARSGELLASAPNESELVGPRMILTNGQVKFTTAGENQFEVRELNSHHSLYLFYEARVDGSGILVFAEPGNFQVCGDQTTTSCVTIAALEEFSNSALIVEPASAVGLSNVAGRPYLRASTGQEGTDALLFPVDLSEPVIAVPVPTSPGTQPGGSNGYESVLVTTNPKGETELYHYPTGTKVPLSTDPAWAAIPEMPAGWVLLGRGAAEAPGEAVTLISAWAPKS